MQSAVLLLLFVALVQVAHAEVEPEQPCDGKTADEECKQTNFREYRKCMKRRAKRQVCPFAQQQQQQQQPVPLQQPQYVQQPAPQQQLYIQQDQQPPQVQQPQYINLPVPQQPIYIQQPIEQPQSCVGGNCNIVNVPGMQQCQALYTNCLNACPDPQCREQCPYSCPEVKSGSSSVIIVDNSLPTNCQPGPGGVQCSAVQMNNKTGSLTNTVTSSGSGGHNITTVIKLTNLVNNTNIVNVPTQVNSTNINNINLSSNNTGGQWGLGATSKGSCCQAVQPRTCRQGRLGPRCQHRRHRTCGAQCTARVIHVQSRRRCVAATQDCTHRVVYVPQPRPTCTYQSAWPYVSCNAHAQEQSLSCDGCYDHYGYGFQRFHQGQAPSCSGCFDDGFDQGPLYRQGPFYQPGFYHQPPAYQQGCGPEGCFGHQYVDPAYGGFNYGSYGYPYAYPPPSLNNYDYRRPPYQGNSYNDDYSYDDYDDAQYTDVTDLVEGKNQTIYEEPNCTMISEDGALIPCNNSASIRNPYAKLHKSDPKPRGNIPRTQNIPEEYDDIDDLEEEELEAIRAASKRDTMLPPLGFGRRRRENSGLWQQFPRPKPHRRVPAPWGQPRHVFKY